ncbi:MAG: hypothetical protein CVV64_16135 [Candidatus Wallbacteria bacterium HGW-Wallbacteria-1]|jgi:transposase|uniref:Transposase n=1 Tax=Candidatus Wallbacteria bacterium HGW-Wallbacteria-1 TaxID=2013854 RepID=A0A2N1PL69_9BACT|nr:MAG: hypothetical protein CVV64_16135 [Candidatus Wallbacteria bacterium HGW-Wallbacteria-1]
MSISKSEDVGKKTRRKWSTSMKAEIVRIYLRDRLPLSDLADKYDISPQQISQWVKEALDNLENSFGKDQARLTREKDRELREKETKIINLNAVVSELSTEVLQLKKANGAGSKAARFRPR